jgi:hypothetical protein
MWAAGLSLCELVESITSEVASDAALSTPSL